MAENYEPNEEFLTDDEVTEGFESVVRALAEEAVEEDNESSMINPFTMAKITCVYKMLKYVTKGTGAKVECQLHTPFNSMGYVSVTGKKIKVKDPNWLNEAIELASNFEAYPKTDGTVQMNFTFHGLTVPIE